MKELCIAILIAVSLLSVAFYQSFRDQRRWKRISSGMSLFGEREDIPPLILDGTTFDARDRRVMVIWSDRKRTGFNTVSEARMKVEKERSAGTARAKEVRIFAWNGESWQQRA